ncbi:MAG: glucosaminidase domain-containing protein [Spirochaetia bacterium]|nr:glucosaminidase domain-containing protein [Spirochaetia bacterium]
MRKLLSASLLTLFLGLLFSCATYENTKQSFSGVCSRDIAAIGIKDAYELEQFFLAHNPKADKAKVKRLAGYYVTEGRFEGINSDVAFVQMCLETGFLRFGGLVKPSFNNFCGLGAMNKQNPGEKFPSEAIGVRAHIQHLHAFATKDKKLRNKLVDPRYKYVQPRGKAPTIWKLAGTWAMDKNYGNKLDALLKELDKH